MPRYTIGPDGSEYTTYTEKEFAEREKWSVLLILGSPLLFLGYYVHNFASEVWHWHELFSLLAAAAPVGAIAKLLVWSRICRAIYLGSETVAAAAFTFLLASSAESMGEWRFG